MRAKREGIFVIMKIKNKAVRAKFLPFALPSIDNEEIKEVIDTLKSGWITTGPKTHMFEEKIKKYIGANHVIAVNSCTSALHLSLVVSGIKQGDEVITTPLTFASTANTIVHQGAKPVFVDIKRDTYNIDPRKIEENISDKTKAIIPVHYAGQPCEMNEILKIAEKNDLKVIEDAAHAIGAEYHGKKIGTIGDITCFSFYATKNITTGDGGAVVANNDEIAEKIRILSLHGMSKDAWKRYSSKGSWYYEITYPGYKYNMTDIQAALGLHQIDKLDEFIKIRKKYCIMYNMGFKDMEEIITPYVKENVKHVRHLYPILIKPELLKINRNKFIEALREENIGTSVHFIPLHLHPFYREKYGYVVGDYPNAEYVYNNLISLPLYPKMTEEDVYDVITAIKKLVDYYKKGDIRG